MVYQSNRFGITSDYIEFQLRPPWVSVLFQMKFRVIPMCFPFDLDVVPMGFPGGFLHELQTQICKHVYICAGYGVPVPRAPQDHDMLMEPLRHLMSPSDG